MTLCTAHRANGSGEQCKAHAMQGSRVCVVHGGKARQVRERAARRLEELAWPAAVRIGKLIDHRNPNVALAAAKDVLDRNGFKAIERVQQDGRILIEVELVDRIAPLPRALTNGVVDIGDAPDSAT